MTEDDWACCRQLQYYVSLQQTEPFLAKLPSCRLWWQFQFLFFIWSAFGNFFSPLKTLVAHREHRLKLLSQCITSWSTSGRLGAVAANPLDKFLAGIAFIIFFIFYFFFFFWPFSSIFFFFFEKSRVGLNFRVGWVTPIQFYLLIFFLPHRNTLQYWIKVFRVHILECKWDDNSDYSPWRW